MSAQHLENHPEWSGRLAFILASAGSAVGLGNIWKFPYIMGDNGGGAFVMIYLACLLIVATPILVVLIYVDRSVLMLVKPVRIAVTAPDCLRVFSRPKLPQPGHQVGVCSS